MEWNYVELLLVGPRAPEEPCFCFTHSAKGSTDFFPSSEITLSSLSSCRIDQPDQGSTDLFFLEKKPPHLLLVFLALHHEPKGLRKRRASLETPNLGSGNMSLPLWLLPLVISLGTTGGLAGTPTGPRKVPRYFEGETGIFHGYFRDIPGTFQGYSALGRERVLEYTLAQPRYFPEFHKLLRTL